METSFTSDLIKLIFILLLTTGLIVGMLFLLKYIRNKTLKMHKYSQLKLIGMLSLGPKKAVAVVEVFGQWLVLGVGSENITLLTKIENPERSRSENKEVPT